LFFHKGAWEKVVDPLNNYEIFDFIPDESTNVYKVPNIGDVILNKPVGDNIIWYGECVRILFEKGFTPPEIASGDDLEDLSLETFLNVGKELQGNYKSSNRSLLETKRL
jgi:hypothetical protein